MGIATKLRRFMHNEPVFKPEDATTEEKQVTAATTPDVEVGEVVPIVRIDTAECVIESGYTNIFAHLHNESPEAVTLKSVGLLGETRELDIQLPGKESERVLLFVGIQLPEVSHQEAELRYKTKESKILAAHYKIVGKTSSDGKIAIDGFKLQIPIREEAAA